MARFSQNYEYYDQSPTTLDAKPVFSEDDESSVLDDKILDPNTPDVSSMSDHRRPSYDTGPEDMARSSMFPQYAAHASHAQVRHAQQSTDPLFDAANTGFVRMETPQSMQYAHQPANWPLSSESGSCTPTPNYDSYSAEYEVGGPVSYANSYMGAMNYSGIPFRNNPNAPPGAVAMSPQSSQGWMSAASSEAHDARALPRRSPTYRPTSPMHLRRDGIRKKNARFEIPPERTLSTIDQLIGQSQDEQEIKELKQQKRLLRNRQAALDSRQRKKVHTEKLEEEKKHFTNMITELEDTLEQMRLREKTFMREKAEWVTTQQQYKQYIDGLAIERDEMIRNHTLETADLRKKNSFLTEQIQKLESAAISAPSSAGFTSGFSDFENITMENGAWDDFSSVNDYSMDPHPLDEPDLSAMETTPKRPSSEKSLITADTSLGFSWNAFYMCLLLGAFIASNSSSSSSNISSLPQLSDEYRAESSNVLKAVLSSSPSKTPEVSNQPQPITQQAQPATITSAEMARITSGPGPSSLDNLHHDLVTPSKQQESEQLFSLSADQYNSLTSLDDDDIDIGNHEDEEPRMTNLQAALAATRNGSSNNPRSEVYTRSLMWDRVPEKVLRDFKEMVKECGGNEQE